MSNAPAAQPSEDKEYRLSDELQAAWGRAIDDEAESFADLSEEQKNTIKQAFQEALTFAIQHATAVKTWRERNPAHNLEDALAEILEGGSTTSREDVRHGKYTFSFDAEVMQSIDNPSELQRISRSKTHDFLKKVLASPIDQTTSEANRQLGELMGGSL